MPTPTPSTSPPGILAVAIHASSALPSGDVQGPSKVVQRLLWGGVRVAVLVEGGTEEGLLSSLCSVSLSVSNTAAHALVKVELCSCQTLQGWKRALSSAVTSLGLPAASVALAVGACRVNGDSDGEGCRRRCSSCCPSSETAKKEEESPRASPAEAAARELGCPVILVVVDDQKGNASRNSNSSTSTAIECAVAQSHSSSSNSPRAAAALLVGVCMRASREESLLSRGMLPRVPPPLGTQRQGEKGGESLGEGGGASAATAVVFERVLASELEERCSQAPPLAAILHKVTDELGEDFDDEEGDEEGEDVEEGKRKHPFWPRAARSLAALSSSVAARGPASSSSSVVVVDDVASVMRLSDRFETAEALREALGAGAAAFSPPLPPPLPSLLVARPPPSLLVSASEAELFFSACSPATSATALLSEAGISFPVIVKPRAACGVPEAHRLAVALDERGLGEALRAVLGGESSKGQDKARSCLSFSLNRRRPPAGALIQRYVDHGGVIFKVYAAAAGSGGGSGETVNVFVERRASTPDLSPRGSGGSKDYGCPGWLSFDSAAPLSDAAPWPFSKTAVTAAAAEEEKQARVPSLDPRVALATAEALLSGLGLSLLGFDVVVERGTGECFVVDVNYFPSMKGGETPRGVLVEAVAAQVARVRRKTEEEKNCEEEDDEKK